MKAKIYAQKIIAVARKPDVEFNAVMKEVSQDLVREVSELIRTRNCQSYAAITAVFDEIDDKYQAICRIVNSSLNCDLLYPMGFRELVFDIADKNGLDTLRVAWHPKRIKTN